MEVEIRKASDNDKSAVLEPGRKNVNIYERTHLGDELADGYIESGACDSDLSSIYENASVALCDDKVIGFVFIEGNEIQRLSVDNEHWGKGVGQKLLDYATREISKTNKEIILECFVSSPIANRFYKKMSFENSGVIDGDGGNRILYKKKYDIF
ncbi:GNAT family N-acetyltransferase [Tannockella kyphosi]|uniref:GNAT family N-acetyltransferase n=1 Tax=Tannockella kyphosi TaxID=2899121 RepID=UPI00201330CC|nr:GNAT family N-acetyltransferase [Tannockella kyphosi]